MIAQRAAAHGLELVVGLLSNSKMSRGPLTLVLQQPESPDRGRMKTFPAHRTPHADTAELKNSHESGGGRDRVPCRDSGTSKWETTSNTSHDFTDAWQQTPRDPVSVNGPLQCCRGKCFLHSCSNKGRRRADVPLLCNIISSVKATWFSTLLVSVNNRQLTWTKLFCEEETFVQHNKNYFATDSSVTIEPESTCATFMISHIPD